MEERGGRACAAPKLSKVERARSMTRHPLIRLSPRQVVELHSDDFGIEGFLVLSDIFQAHFLAVSRRGFLQHPHGIGVVHNVRPPT